MTIPAHMRAYQLIGHGGPEMLRLVPDAPTPKTSIGEVLIHVGAAGLNNTDINTRVGWYSKGDGQAEDASWGGGAIQFPRIQGADICGTVVEVGEGADTALLGKRVLVEPCLREAAGQSLESPSTLVRSVTAVLQTMSPWPPDTPIPLIQRFLTRNWPLFPALTRRQRIC